MRKKVLILIIWCIMFVPVFGAATDTFAKGPQAFLPDRVYEFEPVVEGSQVVHDFILHNRGDETLKIIEIKSG